MRRHQALALLTTAFLVVLSSSLGFAVGYQPLRVEPSLLTFEGKPGDQFTGTIKVTNKGTESVSPKAVLSDWTLDMSNQLVVQDAGTLDSSFNGWVKFNPRQFSLPVEGTQTVRFTIKIPNDAKPGEKRGMIAFEQIVPYDGGAMGATAKVQVTTTIYVSILPVSRKVDISGLSIQADKASGRSNLALQIQGTGNAHFTGAGKFAILPEKLDKSIATGETEPIVVMPGVVTRFNGYFAGNLAPGKYRLSLEITSTTSGSAPLARIYPFEVR